MDHIKHTLLLVLWLIARAYDVLRPRRAVAILCYHAVVDDDAVLSVSPEQFRVQLETLRRDGCHFVSIADTVAYARGEKMLPKRPVAITFDDGYANVLTDALPVLKEFHAPATVFVVGEADEAEARIEPYPLLSRTQEQELTADGLVTLGYHSRTHRLLHSLSSSDIAREVTSPAFRWFAYPGGKRPAAASEEVERQEYEAAFGISIGLVQKGDNLFTLRRNVIERSMRLWEIRARASYAIGWYSAWKRRLRIWHLW